MLVVDLVSGFCSVGANVYCLNTGGVGGGLGGGEAVQYWNINPLDGHIYTH